MALIGNRSVLHKSPGRFLSGTVASIERCNFSKAGMLANRFQAMSGVFGGLPSGHLAPSSWALPRTAGGMSAVNSAVGLFVASALAVGGITTTGDSLVTFTVPDAAGQLISSGSGDATLTFSASGNLLASLSAAGSAAFTLATNSPQLGAEANVVGAASLAVSAGLVPYAVGHMVGTTQDSGTLTPAAISAAVWSAAVRTLTGSSSSGLTATEQLQLAEIWQRLGLDPAAPMATGPAAITFAGESIAIAESGGTVTLTRQP